MRTRISIGVVLGRGYTENLAQAFAALPQADLRWICGGVPAGGDTLQALPVTRRATSLEELLDDEDLDVIAIDAPIEERYELVAAALRAAKHVCVAGPIACRADNARELVGQAKAQGLRLVGLHPSQHDPALVRLRELIADGELGELFYLQAFRPAPPRRDAEDGLLWRDAAADVASILSLVGDEPVEVEARGESYVDPLTPDLLSCHLTFATGITASLQLSTLDAEPGVKLSAVGCASTAVISGTGTARRLTVFARDGSAKSARGLPLAPGDAYSPHIPSADPLRRCCIELLLLIGSAGAAHGDQQDATLVDVLERLERSLQTDRRSAPHDLRLVQNPVLRANEPTDEVRKARR